MRFGPRLIFTTGLALLAAGLLPAFAAGRSGAELYQTYCASCHSGGWQGAPVAGIKDEWETRLANGRETLAKRARDGVNAMPPMGTCLDCTDEELNAAIDEMLKF